MKRQAVTWSPDAGRWAVWQWDDLTRDAKVLLLEGKFAGGRGDAIEAAERAMVGPVFEWMARRSLDD